MVDPTGQVAVIHRPSLLGAVWLSYRTRWLIWILTAGVGLVFGAVAWSIWSDEVDSIGATNPRGLRSAEPTAPLPSPSAWVAIDADLAKPDWSRLRSLSITNLENCKPLWTAGAIPQLESLSIFSSITDEQLVELCRLYDLKSLTLYDSNLLSQFGLRAWKNERKLEYLRVPNLNVVRENRPLDWPINLRTLVCDDPNGITRERLNEWRQLPHLRSLSTRLIPRENSVPGELLESLKAFPSLKSLFVVELGPSFPQLVSNLQSELPALRVRPSSFDSVRGQRAAAILLCGLLVAVVLSIQLSAQFLISNSSLIPRFAQAHLGPVVAVSLAVALLSFWLHRLNGCSIVASLSLCGANLLLLALGARLLRGLQNASGYPMPGFINPMMLFPVIVFSVLGFQLLTMLYGSEFDWFLRSQHHLLAAMLLAGSVWGAFDLAKWLIGLKRELEQSGAGNVPLGMFDFGGLTEWGKTVVAIREREGKRPSFAFRNIDARGDRLIERLRDGKRPTPMALWIFSGAANLFDTLKLFAPMLVVLSVVGFCLIPDAWSQYGFLVASGGFQLLGSLLFMPLLFAWQRRPMCGMELLRPVSRRDWVGRWFQGVGSETAAVLLVTIVFATVMWRSGLLGVWSTMDAYLCTAIVVGEIIGLYALGMWALTLRALSLITLVAGIGWMIVLFCIVMPIVLRVQIINWWTPTILISTMIGLSAVVTAGLWFAWRSWMNWEVGSSV